MDTFTIRYVIVYGIWQIELKFRDGINSKVINVYEDISLGNKPTINFNKHIFENTSDKNIAVHLYYVHQFFWECQ